MGNISNIFSLKGQNGDWASTKCDLDTCYTNPYAQGDELYIEADIPDPYWASEAWICSMDGTRLQNLIPLTDWKIVYTDDVRKFIFRMPDDSYACNTIPDEEGCFVDFFNDNTLPFPVSILQDWMNGDNNATVGIIHLGVTYPLGDYGEQLALPAGWSWINDHTVAVPCGIPYPSIGTNYTTTSNVGGSNFTFGNNVQTGEVPGTNLLNCWYIEIPLFEGDTEVATLSSEPFACPDSCTPTLVVSSDYCLQPFDIFGTYIFDTTTLGGTQYGFLTEAKNNWRIPAVIRKIPSTTISTRNIKCNTFKSKLTERFRLQGAWTDYPDYLVNILESIASGKKFYVDGVQYQPPLEGNMFEERNINGRSMVRLNVELTKCEIATVFDCSCVLPPVDCEENPIEYDGGFLILTVPKVAYGQTNAVLDNTYIWAEIDGGSISGGTPPYMISDWYEGNGKVSPNNDLEVFDDSREYNIFRRNVGTLEPCGGCLSITVKITDANGCTKILGQSVDLADMRCAGFGASFTTLTPTANSITIDSITTEFGLNAFACFDISINGTQTGYQITGETSLPYVISGLTPDTDYQIVVRVWCECPVDPNNPVGEQSGIIGPAYISTLP